VRASEANRQVRGACMSRLNGDDLLIATAVGEDYLAVGEREQRVVFTHADVLARVELRAALAHDDVAGRDRLTAVQLHAEPLALRIATVARGAEAFFVGKSLEIDDKKHHKIVPNDGATVN